MKIITHFGALNYDVDKVRMALQTEEGRMGLKEEILTDLQDIFNLAQEHAGILLEKGLQAKIVFGLTDPEQVIQIAESWNDEITKNFVDAVGQVATIGNGVIAVKSVQLDRRKTQILWEAAEELSDVWQPGGKHGAYLNSRFGIPCFFVMLREEDLEDIRKYPHTYIVADVKVVSN